MPLPTPGDIKALHTWIWFELRDGNHILVKMDPADSTKLMQQYIEAQRKKEGFVFHIPDPDRVFQDFIVPAECLKWVRTMDDAHAAPIAQAEVEQAEQMAAAARLRANDFQIGAPGPRLVKQ